MKRAHKRREYRNVHSFEAPEGVVTVEVDPTTGMLATANCREARSEVFIAGSQPIETCRLHGGGRTQVSGWEATPPVTPVAPAPAGDPGPQPRREVAASTPAPPPGERRSVTTIPITPQPVGSQKPPEPRKGFLGRLKDIFK
jgi:hypothetical protein